MLSRIQNLIFIALFLTAIGLLGWLSERHSMDYDLTWGKRNSLTEASVNALQALDKPITITAFVRDDSKAIHDLVNDLIERYQQHKSDIDLKFINPDLVPQLVREHSITVDGQILVLYGNRQETLQNPSEKSLTQLLVKLAATDNSYVAFLTGHGERDLLGAANHDLGDFGRQLELKGFILQAVNLIKNPSIPANTRILVISSPKTAFLEGEEQLIEQYLDNGGNVLWLTEPDSKDELSSLAAYFDIKRLPGQVVDATTRLFGIDDPTFALVVDFPRHAITEQLHSQTLFPQASGLASAEESSWFSSAILQTLSRSWTELNDIDGLQTLSRSWTELNDIDGEVRFDEDTDERPGPITIGYALEREQATPNTDKPGKQRVVMIGDGDFLSNAYLGNGQNLDLGSAIFQWLNHNDDFIDIGSVKAPDTQLGISQSGAIGLLMVFMILLPLGLLGTGTTIWLKRRRR
jgi:ABC-type uncharacterized transport system involved in gliding motility auxiliary subunit